MALIPSAQKKRHARERSFWWSRRGGSVAERKRRTLALDPLEKREMLTLVPQDFTDIEVSQEQAPNIEIDARTGNSVAVDNDGDFVSVWVREDEIIGLDGQPTFDPVIGRSRETNIYARYFTDEVQRITLPASAAGGNFSLIFNGEQVVQELKLDTDQIPLNGKLGPFQGQGLQSASNILQGEFVVGFDVDGDGTIAREEQVKVTFGSGAALQAALRSLGGALENATVREIAPTNMVITYDAEPAPGGGFKQIQVLDTTDLDGGFFPSVDAPVSSFPITLSDPNPLFRGLPIRLLSNADPNVGARQTGDLIRLAFADIGVTVEVTSRFNAGSQTYEFDVHFIDRFGKRDFPELIVSALNDSSGNPLGTSQDNPDIRVRTLKEPSAEFRVNAPEEPDPITGELKQLNQGSPSVSMDADGDFVIVWVGEVSDQDDFGSQTDIFARRYNSRGEPESDQFRVNEFTPNRQFFPSVEMDDAGNFVVGWVAEGQNTLDGSFFNNVIGRRFDLNGNPLGGSFTVSTEVATEDVEMDLDVSPDGHFTFAWANIRGGLSIQAAVYGPDGDLMVAPFFVDTIPVEERFLNEDPSVGMDAQNRFYITWNKDWDPETEASRTAADPDRSVGIYMEAYEIQEVLDGAGNVIGFQENLVNPEFRVNSAWRILGDIPSWPFDQFEPSLEVDEDGDAIVLYEGFGIDVDYFAAENDPDANIRDNLIPTMHQNTFDEQQTLTLFQDEPDPTGTFVMQFGDFQFGTDPNNPLRYSTGEIQIVQVFPLVDPLFGNQYELSFAGETDGPFPWSDPMVQDPGENLAATVEAFLLGRNNPPEGVIVETGPLNGADIDGDGIADIEIRITFSGESRLIDWPPLLVNPLFGNNNDATANATTTTFADAINIAINNQLQSVLRRGNVSVVPTFFEPDDPEEDGSFFTDLNGDDVEDLELNLRWSQSVTGINMPRIEFFQLINDDGERLAIAEEQVITIFPQQDPLTGTYMLQFGDRILRPFTFTTPEALEAQLDISVNALVGGGVEVSLTEDSGLDLNGDDIPDIQIRLVFAEGNADNVDQPDLLFLPAVDDQGNPLPDAIQATTITTEILKGASGRDLTNTVRVRARNEEIDRGRVNVEPIRAERDRLESIFSDNRGSAGDIMLAGFDADPQFQTNAPGISELVLNDRTEGHNHRVVLLFGMDDFRAVNGNIPAQYSGSFELVFAGLDDPLAVDWPDPDSNDTIADSINDAIEGAPLFSDQFPEPPFIGKVVARIIPGNEIANRVGTQYELVFNDFVGNGRALGSLPGDIAVEVTFLGPAHELPVGVGFGDTSELMVEEIDNGQGGNNNQGGDDEFIATSNFQVEIQGGAGTPKRRPSIAMEPDGDFVATWVHSAGYFGADPFFSDIVLSPSNYGSYFGTSGNEPPSVVYRRYDETTDTAGPRVTEFVLPSGSELDRLTEGEQVIQPLSFLVVSFDEDMMAEGPSSVTDPRNWALLRDGIPVSGGIRAIDYGMNRASDMGLGPATNKYEAIVQFDGNGPQGGAPALSDGTYEIVAKNSLRDRAGNPLGRRGQQIQGAESSRMFSVVGFVGGETRVNQTTPGDQSTARQTQSKSISSDQDGDYVAVWTSQGSGPDVQQGLFATVYRGRERGGSPERVREVLVTSDPTASSASVARDGDGDFVVTWSSYDPGEPVNNWDVYARRFDALGNPLGPEFRVNTETENMQRFSTVAMDADGDFVIAWQSFDQYGDDSGYGIFAQRYNPLGEAIGGANETQLITFAGAPREGDFRLEFEGQTTELITFDRTTALTAPRIEEALEALPNISDVLVTALSREDVLVEFLGPEGRRDLDAIIARNVRLRPSGVVTVSPIVEGAGGEFLVTDTTQNDQIEASIAMSAIGDFVISWTSFGQDGDSSFESNVYAREFLRNELAVPVSSRTQRQQLIDMLTVRTSESAAITYAPGTPQQDIDIIEKFVLVGSTPGKWGPPVFGTGATITWGFMPAGVQDVNDLDGLVPGWTNQTLDTFMPVGWDAEIRRAFDAWAQVADLTFVEVTDPGLTFGADSPDIRIGAHPVDGPGTTLAYAFIPPDIGSGIAGDIFFDTQDQWDIGFGGAGVDIFQVAAHEIGHALGLAHTDVPNSLMNPAYSEAFVGPQPDDIAGMQFIYGQRRSIGARGSEFLVNQTTASNQRQSDVAMDADGDYVVAWTSYGNDGGGGGYGAGNAGREGVFARRFDAGSSGVSTQNEFRVNTTIEGNQQAPRVSMDAAGDFVVAWESYQDRPTGSDTAASYGIFAQRYVRHSLVGSANFFGLDGEVGGEFRVNVTREGDQQSPSVAVDNEGDFVILWSGFGGQTGTGQDDADGGVFFSRTETEFDESGPMVASVLSPVNGGFQPVIPGSVIETRPAGESNSLVVTFGEDVFADASGSFRSVTNPGNWQLRFNGVTLSAGVLDVEYGLNLLASKGLADPSDKYEALLQLDGDPEEPGIQPLERGNYTLVALDRIEDNFENRLDGDFDGTRGGNFSLDFTVGQPGVTTGGGGPLPDPPGTPVPDPEDPNDVPFDTPVNTIRDLNQNEVAMGMNDAGDFVLVWTSFANDPEGDIVGQRFNNVGTPLGAEFIVSNLPGRQRNPEVAMDSLGGFTVAWEGIGADGFSFIADDQGIWARQYDFTGRALNPAFIVNEFLEGNQTEPTLAVDSVGDVIVAWTSDGQDGDRNGVFARRFDSFGDPLSREFRVNATTVDRQEQPDVAVDSDGDFVVVWNSYQQDGSSWGVFGQRFNQNGNRAGGEFRVNGTTRDRQRAPAVAMDDDGDFVVAWQSYTPGQAGYDIFAQRYSRAGGAVGSEFRVNQQTTFGQEFVDVAMSGDGDFYFTWTSFRQDGDDLGIYARLYNADGSNFANPRGGGSLGEFRVNRTTLGSQFTPVVAADADGDLAVAWVGPDLFAQVPSGDDIFVRFMLVNDPVPSTIDTSSANFGQLGANSNGGTDGGSNGGGDPLPGSWRNLQNPLDVNNDGSITALDVLRVINDLNTNGARDLGDPPPANTVGQSFLDVNGDGFVSAADALQVINQLNSQTQQQAPAPAPARSVQIDPSSDMEAIAARSVATRLHTNLTTDAIVDYAHEEDDHWDLLAAAASTPSGVSGVVEDQVFGQLSDTAVRASFRTREVSVDEVVATTLAELERDKRWDTLLDDLLG